MYLILLALLVPFTASSNFINYTQDFGRIVEEKSPISILKPTTPADISFLQKSIYSSPSQSDVTVAARGAGHSTYGQAQAPGGIIIDTTSLPSSIRVEKGYVDVSGGALWVDVLNETLKHGQSPRSWTDYLYLTVGGTLSNAGISGQTFKYGPQVSNVIELDIVTVSILQSTTPSCSRGSQCLDTLLTQNQKIIDIATSKPIQMFYRENAKIAALKEGHIKSSEGGLGAKQYLPYLKNEREWMDHFRDKWDRFRKLKERFDPLNVLTPGQRIFKRKSIDK